MSFEGQGIIAVMTETITGKFQFLEKQNFPPVQEN